MSEEAFPKKKVITHMLMFEDIHPYRFEGLPRTATHLCEVNLLRCRPTWSDDSRITILISGSAPRMKAPNRAVLRCFTRG